MITKLKEYIKSIDIENIPASRKTTLQVLVDFIRNKIDQQKDVHLNFICTHNSRRSHFAQIWAQVIAFYFDIKKVHCYSGGTETTALYPLVLKTLEEVGIKIEVQSIDDNPIYHIIYSDDSNPIRAYSKKHNDDINPQSSFAAIMTCSHADQNCPFISGAEKRIPITYEDPKKYDGTTKQKEKYRERSLQIATEMFYVFSQLKKKNEHK